MLAFLQSPFLGKKFEAKSADAPKPEVSKKKTEFYLIIHKWGLLVFISVWSFILGILVGRGTIPNQFDRNQFKNELIHLKETMASNDLKKYSLDGNSPFEKVNLGYHEALKFNKHIDIIPTLKESKRPELVKPSEQKQADSKQAEVKKTQPAAKQKPTVEKIPTEIGVPDALPADSGKLFSIQVASFQDSSVAEKKVESLKQKGYSAYKIAVDIAGKGTWYRVRIGHFKTRNDAQSSAGSIKAEYPSMMIIQD